MRNSCVHYYAQRTEKAKTYRATFCRLHHELLIIKACVQVSRDQVQGSCPALLHRCRLPAPGAVQAGAPLLEPYCPVFVRAVHSLWGL